MYANVRIRICIRFFKKVRNITIIKVYIIPFLLVYNVNTCSPIGQN